MKIRTGWRHWKPRPAIHPPVFLCSTPPHRRARHDTTRMGKSSRSGPKKEKTTPRPSWDASWVGAVARPSRAAAGTGAPAQSMGARLAPPVSGGRPAGPYYERFQGDVMSDRQTDRRHKVFLRAGRLRLRLAATASATATATAAIQSRALALSASSLSNGHRAGGGRERSSLTPWPRQQPQPHPPPQSSSTSQRRHPGRSSLHRWAWALTLILLKLCSLSSSPDGSEVDISYDRAGPNVVAAGHAPTG